MAVLPNIFTHTAEVTIDDIQVRGPDIPLTEDQEKLSLLIWRNKPLSYW